MIIKAYCKTCKKKLKVTYEWGDMFCKVCGDVLKQLTDIYGNSIKEANENERQV